MTFNLHTIYGVIDFAREDIAFVSILGIEVAQAGGDTRDAAINALRARSAVWLAFSHALRVGARYALFQQCFRAELREFAKNLGLCSKDEGILYADWRSSNHIRQRLIGSENRRVVLKR